MHASKKSWKTHRKKEYNESDIIELAFRSCELPLMLPCLTGTNWISLLT